MQLQRRSLAFSRLRPPYPRVGPGPGSARCMESCKSRPETVQIPVLSGHICKEVWQNGGKIAGGQHTHGLMGNKRGKKESHALSLLFCLDLGDADYVRKSLDLWPSVHSYLASAAAH